MVKYSARGGVHKCFTDVNSRGRSGWVQKWFQCPPLCAVDYPPLAHTRPPWPPDAPD